jgi:hypothetical protein
MVHIATMAEKGIRNAAADYVNRKWSMSIGALPPLPPSKRHAMGIWDTTIEAPCSGRRYVGLGWSIFVVILFMACVSCDTYSFVKPLF